MPLTDKTIDESQLKELYKKKIRQYLPQEWGDYKVNEFVNSLFMGVACDPSTEFGEVVFRISKKWLFSKLTFSIYDNGNEHKVVKYFPNPKAAGPMKKEGQKSI